MKKVFCLFMSFLVIGLFKPLTVSSNEEIDLLNYEDNGEMLGVASAFSVFVEEDFGANGCDCEGRIYAGHSANVGESKYYSAAYDDGASVIIGDGTLSNFDIGHRIFVYGTNATNLLEGGQVYQTDLFDKEKVFKQLKRKSIELSYVENGYVRKDTYWSNQINFIGEDPKLNVFNLDPSMITSCNYFFNYDVPEGSYVVVNVSGKENTAYTQLYGMQYSGRRSTNNKDEINKKILFNYYDTDNLTLAGTGTFYGTILAPFANVTDDITEGTHYAGGIIAKNYLGGVEWGSCTFDGGDGYDEDIEPEETTAIVFTSNTSINTTSIYTTEDEGTTTDETTSTAESTTITEQRESNYTTSTTSTTTSVSDTSTTAKDTTTTYLQSEVYSSTTETTRAETGTTSGFGSGAETTQTTGRNYETTATTGTSGETVNTGFDTTGTSAISNGIETNTRRTTSISEVKETSAATPNSTDEPAKTKDDASLIFVLTLIAILCLFITKK